MVIPTESQFGKDFRAALRDQRLEYIQVVEAGLPGAPDNYVFDPVGDTICKGWVELKVGDNGFEPSQPAVFEGLIDAGDALIVIRHIGDWIQVWHGCISLPVARRAGQLMTRIELVSPVRPVEIDWRALFKYYFSPRRR